MNIYRIHPEDKTFEINGVFIPYQDVIADDEESANRAAIKLGLKNYSSPKLISSVKVYEAQIELNKRICFYASEHINGGRQSEMFAMANRVGEEFKLEQTEIDSLIY